MTKASYVAAAQRFPLKYMLRQTIDLNEAKRKSSIASLKAQSLTVQVLSLEWPHCQI